MADEIKTILYRVEVDADQAQRAAGELEAQLQQLGDERAKLSKQLKELRRDEAANAAEIQKVSQALAANKRQAADVSREYRMVQNQIRATTGSIDAQRAALAKLTRQYDSFAVGIDGTQDDLQALGKDIAMLTQHIKDQEYATLRFQRNVGNYKADIMNAFAQVGNIPGIPGGLGGLANLFSGTSLGITAVAGGAVLAANEMRKLAVEVDAVRRETEKVTGAQGAMLSDVAASAKAISDVYQKDLNEVLISANALSKQMGISLTDALGIINKGFASGADAQNQFLDILKEYPAQFQKAGVSASEFVAIVAQTQREGVFSDKGLDAIKEATIRLQAMEAPTKEALQAIGIDAQKLQAAIQDGTMSTFEAIQQVSGRLEELGATSSEANRAISAVFGSAGEDAGNFVRSLGDVETGLDGVLAKQSEFARAQAEQAESFARLNRELQALFGGTTNFFAEAKAAGADFLASILNGMRRWAIAIEQNIKGTRALFSLDFEGAREAFSSWWNAVSGGNINGTQAGGISGILQRAAGGLKQMGTEASAAAPKMQAVAKSVENVQKEVAAITQTAAVGSLSDLRQQVADLRKQLEAADPGSTVFYQLVIQAREAEAQLRVMENRLQEIRTINVDESRIVTDATIENIDVRVDAYNSEAEAFEDAQRRMRGAEDARFKAGLEGWDTWLQASSQTIGMVSDLFIASKEAEVNAAQNNQAELLAINKRYFQIFKALSIAQAAINGASAVVGIMSNAWKDPTAPLYLLTGAQIAVAVGTTAAQIAAISSKTFARGGYTGGGYGAPDSSGYRVAGVVHEGEYVVPKRMVESPAFQPVVRSLETARLRGYANGGFVEPMGAGQVNYQQLSSMVAAAVQQSPIFVEVSEISRGLISAGKVASVVNR